MTAKFPSKSIGKAVSVAAAVLVLSTSLAAQKPSTSPTTPPAKPPAPAAPTTPAPAPAKVPPAAAQPTAVPLPAGYVIGAEDILSIRYWKDADLSTDVAVRPDGKISLQLLNDVEAAGLTPEQLRTRLMEQSKKYLEDPQITVIVKEINSRKVFITGEVQKAGPYPLTTSTTVLQLIALAGGLREYADGKNIVIVRNENGKSATYGFNYRDVISRKNLNQNIELKPGDTVIVP
jgi:polysaccharide biosynthesis/export protein